MYACRQSIADKVNVWQLYTPTLPRKRSNLKGDLSLQFRGFVVLHQQHIVKTQMGKPKIQWLTEVYSAWPELVLNKSNRFGVNAPKDKGQSLNPDSSDLITSTILPDIRDSCNYEPKQSKQWLILIQDFTVLVCYQIYSFKCEIIKTVTDWKFFINHNIFISCFIKITFYLKAELQ